MAAAIQQKEKRGNENKGCGGKNEQNLKTCADFMFLK